MGRARAAQRTEAGAAVRLASAKLLDGNGARIVTRGRGYELRLVDGEVDAVRFERLIEQERPREALALWRSAPLADVADEPSRRLRSGGWRNCELRAAELAIEGDLTAGRHGEVIAELDALSDQYPLRERLHAQRVLALYRAGRRPRRSRRIGAHGRCWSSRSASSQDPSCDSCTLRSSRRTRRSLSTAGPRRRVNRGESRPTPLPPAAGDRCAAAVRRPLVFGISRMNGSGGLARIAENTVGVIEPDSGAITEQYPVGRGPAAVTAGGGSVWVANALDGTITRINRGRVVTIPVGGAPLGVAFGAGSLWVADGETRRGAGRPGSEQGPAAAPGRQRAARPGGRGQSAMGPLGHGRRDRADRPRQRARDPHSPADREPDGDRRRRRRAVGGERGGGDGDAHRAAHGHRGPAVRVGNGPTAVAAGEEAVWVVNRHDGTLSRIDPSTGAVSWADRVGSDPSAVDRGCGAVWVAGGEDGTGRARRSEGPAGGQGDRRRIPRDGDRDRRWPRLDDRGRRVGRARGRHAARLVPEDHSGGARDRLAHPGRLRLAHIAAHLARL